MSTPKMVFREGKQTRRRFRLVVSPRFQLKYSMYYVAMALVTVASVNALVAYFLVNLIHYGSASAPGASVASVFVRTILENLGIVGAAFIVLGLCYFSLALVLTKNIVGPARVLVLHIEALKQGNYHHRTNLRKTDELKAIMVALNELSETLQERHNSISETGSDVKKVG